MEDLSTQEMHHLIRQKLQELFSICDPDNQGYITLDDLLVQKDQLSIPSEQMGIIFEALDKDGQGYLTMEAFVDGLSTYLSQNLGGGTQSHGQNEASTDDKEHALPNVENINQEQELTTYRNHNINSLIANAESAIDQEDTVFECDLSGDATTDAEIEEFLSEMGMRNNAKYEKLLKIIWPKVRNDPNMSPLFEEFVELVFLDIQEAKTNSDHLENALRNKYEEYDNAMKSLFDEMEIQIIKEREKAKREEEVKERKIREKLQQELNERNRLLQEVINTKEKLRHRIEQLSNVEDEHKEEKERLLKENRDLSKLLKESQEIVKVRQRDIERLAEESEKQRKARIKTTLRMSAGLAKEHESLRTQLTKLQEMNQKLRDDKDALIHDSSPPATNGNRSIQASILPDSWKAENHSHINGQQKGSPTLAKRLVGGNRPLSRAGSLMSKYFPHGRKRQDSMATDDDESPLNSNMNSLVTSVNGSMESLQEEDSASIRQNNRTWSCPDEARISPVEERSKSVENLSLGKGSPQSYHESNTNIASSTGSCDTVYHQHPLEISHDNEELDAKQNSSDEEKSLQKQDRVSSQMDVSNTSSQSQNSAKEDIPQTNEDPKPEIEVDKSKTENNRGIKERRKQMLSSTTSDDEVWTEMTEIKKVAIAQGQHDGGSLPDIHFPQPIEDLQETQYMLLKKKEYKIVFVGDSGVGKSSFVQCFCTDQFNSSYSATIAIDFQVKNLIINGMEIMLQLWDTAGHERFRSLTKSYFRKADGIVMVYDLSNPLSFASLREWMFSVEDGKEDYATVMIIGNKADLADKNRRVQYKDGIKLAKDNDALFTETSAKGAYNLHEAMVALTTVIMHKNQETRLPKFIRKSSSNGSGRNLIRRSVTSRSYSESSTFHLSPETNSHEFVKKKCCASN